MISELVRNKNCFSIEIDNNIFSYSPNEGTEYGRLQVNLCLNKSNSFILTAGTEIKIPLNEKDQNELKTKKDVAKAKTKLFQVKE